jgi:uncharacterized membrane protein
MLYAALKTVHLLALIAWVGGMFFMLAALRPALVVLEGPSRLALMRAVIGRFVTIVSATIGLILLTGLGMLWLHYTALAAAGTRFTMPASWVAMIAFGAVMIGIFEHLRASLFKRMRAALDSGDAPLAAALLAKIRSRVLVNLVLGVVVTAAMKLAG